MAELRKMTPRRRVAVVGAALTLAVAGVWAWHWAYTGGPSADEVREALAGVGVARCEGDPQVHGVEDLGGPGLPDGMWRAREIVCATAKSPDAPRARLAVQYVFRSGGAARGWLRDNGFEPNRGHWLLNGRTVVGGPLLNAREWRGLVGEID